jgi:hypothetical protein
MNFSKISWIQSPESARIWFSSFPGIAPSQCDVSCDALNHLLANDLDGSLTGIPNSTLVSNYNPSMASDQIRCVARPLFGASVCRFGLRSIVLENLDLDRNMRLIGPIRVIQANSKDNQTTFSRGVSYFSFSSFSFVQ